MIVPIRDYLFDQEDQGSEKTSGPQLQYPMGLDQSG
jgi:hypothetical protein